MRPSGVLLAAMCLVSAGSAGQEKPLHVQMLEQKAPSELRQYHAMLEAYARGEEAAGVDALRQWTHERIGNALKLANGPQDPFTPWDRRRYGLAAMLHTDVALRVARGTETAEANWHIEQAGQLLAMGTRARPDDIRSLAEQWYLSLARYLLDGGSPYGALNLLRQGRALLPGNAVVLRESGTLAELFATDFALVGNVTYDPTAVGRRVHLDDVLSRRTGHLNDATEWLRQAARLDPADELLQVHLGRVLALRRDDEEAVQVLNAALKGTKDDAIAYLAAVFTGGLRERQMRLDESALAYRAAITRYPLGHAAYIGLSEVLQRTGKGDEARRVIESLLAEQMGPTREPLWWYHFEPPGVAGARLDALRKDVRQ